jgi:hypothetical protein
LREEICCKLNGATEMSKQCSVHHSKVCVTCASPSRLGIDRRTAAEVYCCSFCNLNSQVLSLDAIGALFRAEATLVAARRSRALQQCNATLTHPSSRTHRPCRGVLERGGPETNSRTLFLFQSMTDTLCFGLST